MRSSKFYQRALQSVGASAEIILFLGGFFLGQKMFVTAITFIAVRIVSKIIMSELMYRRSIMVIRENTPSVNE
jgi:hypothetical protein